MTYQGRFDKPTGGSSPDRLLKLDPLLVSITRHLPPEEPKPKPEQKNGDGKRSTSLSYMCKQAKHKQCSARNCKCECGHPA